MAKKVIIPASYFRVQKERQKHTRAIHLPSGLLAGRKSVPANQSDKTNVIRLVKPFDLNQDKKIDDRDLQAGEIIGRTESSVKPKRINVVSHYRKGKKVDSYIKEN